MQISASSHVAVKAATAARGRPAAGTAETGEARQPGRSHIQRDLKHLVRDVRHQVRDELQELRAAGGDEAKIEAVRTAFHDFRDQVQAAFGEAGKGGAFDAAAVPEGLRQAMIAFTEALRELNGTPAEEPAEEAAAPAEDGDADVSPAPEKLPEPDLALPPGTLLDLTA